MPPIRRTHGIGSRPRAPPLRQPDHRRAEGIAFDASRPHQRSHRCQKPRQGDHALSARNGEQKEHHRHLRENGGDRRRHRATHPRRPAPHPMIYPRRLENHRFRSAHRSARARRLEGAEAASLVGPAPVQRQSGAWKGPSAFAAAELFSAKPSISRRPLTAASIRDEGRISHAHQCRKARQGRHHRRCAQDDRPR